MKQNPTRKMLAALALLGLPFSAFATEPPTTKPTATVTIAKPATDAKAPEQPKPAEVKSTPVQPGAKPAKPAKPAATKLPPVAEGPTTHTVSKGETLGAIARHYGLTSERLALWNRLKNPDRLAIGQRLEIPPASVVPRTVRKPAAPAAPKVAAAKPADPEEVRVTLSSK